MRVVIRTMAEFIGLGVLGLILAFGVNAVRGKSIDVTRAYFKKGPEARPTTPAVTETPDPSAAEGGEMTANRSAQSDVDVPGNTPPPTEKEPVAAKTLDHGFQEVSLQEASDLFNHELAEIRVYLFVDARNDQHYEEGHIPRAIQADHYQLDRYLDDLLMHAESAEKIIVYCNGGECEDSIFMCNNLIDAGVPYDNIYLFAGGWKAWKAGNMPIETGRSEE